MAGLVRGCVKSIVSSATQARDPIIYTKVGYILGLRVSPRHRYVTCAAKIQLQRGTYIEYYALS
jgi:hypothetical protein